MIDVVRRRLAVALEGFSAFERNALSSYFRLCRSNGLAVDVVEALPQARFIVADADHAGVVERLAAARRLPDALFIGAHAPDTALGWMMRPIDPMQVMRRLEAGLALQGPQAAPSYAADVLAARPADVRRPDGSAGRRSSDLPAPGMHALLVGADLALLRRLQRRLREIGWVALCTASAREALALLMRHPARAVFVDTTLLAEVDGHAAALCRHLRTPPAALPAAAQERPRLILLSRGAASDRVHGLLAGCDAVLSPPASEADLRRALHARSPRPRTALPQFDGARYR